MSYTEESTSDDNQDPSENKNGRGSYGGGAAGVIYCLGLIGALIYFLQHATSFLNGFLGVLESFVWPAILVYKLLEFLKI